MTETSEVEIILPHDAHNCCVALSRKPPINEEDGLPLVCFTDVNMSSGK